MPGPKEIVFDELSRLDFPSRWVPAGVQLRQLVTPAGAPEPGPGAAREGTLRVLPERCRSEWSGRTGAGQYGGFVEVRDSGTGASEVTVSLAVSEGEADLRPDAEVEAALAESLRELYLAVSKRVTSP